MDVGGGGGFPSPATEEETIARKRSRRVSFAETTSVHVFDRDEDFETPPGGAPRDSLPLPLPLPGEATHRGRGGGRRDGWGGVPAPAVPLRWGGRLVLPRQRRRVRRLQRWIILNISDMSGIFVNNSLSGTKIGQTFPNLNAFVAFDFVFKAEENQRVSDLRSLQTKSMANMPHLFVPETSLLLGNLIDVLEEIEGAKMELLNLTSAAFGVESQTGQLAFRLCFMSFKSSKRIAFTIDMTDLNRAVYPSEPSELLIKVCEAQTTLAQLNLDKLMVSVRCLQPGRMTILRLCRMVSRLVHALPG